MGGHLISPQKIDRLIAKGRVIVILKSDRIFDVTNFVADHPGGEELITEYQGKEITEVMKDRDSHAHSDSAYEMLEDYFIGTLTDMTDDEVMKEAEAESSAKVLTRTTNFDRDFEEHKFLHLGKPLLMQMLRGNMTKRFYLEQVHKPRHYGQGSAPIFGNFLEPISLTPWWFVPLVWIPVNMLLLTIPLSELPVGKVASLYGLGLCLWTLVEYVMHRFLFHMDALLPDHQVAFTLHFLLHGFHHYLPMDRYRLVLPPALFAVLCPPLYKLAHFVFRDYYVSQAVFCGAHMGYVLYDMTHYFLHHKKLPSIMKATKVYHLDHHYKEYDLGFGVTSRFWDRIFGTLILDTR
ncbi:Ceramide very long chain fatty acid hydroxylase SCS7 [Wickerhamiella sorbophila]|uniref:Ceramide very long chain fatty acid hydroxylase n=1 Tax=Wickerhamiella sorbophila TaxID=45607 RepID=A0A2T0FIS0_9ASCO|nr:Ceramide very long chain fatty acid hydroxylase SCS7 [Wickerhamiella sorbophila]PRT54866.1 Ceramide very long chain fatty acid hydroxylase SCS7 [Wickerhamiella sorbophila]